MKAWAVVVIGGLLSGNADKRIVAVLYAQDEAACRQGAIALTKPKKDRTAYCIELPQK